MNGRPFFGVPGMGEFQRVKVPGAGGSTKLVARGKGVRREAESERSPRQTADLTNRNLIRHMKVGKSANEDEAQSYTEPSV